MLPISMKLQVFSIHCGSQPNIVKQGIIIAGSGGARKLHWYIEKTYLNTTQRQSAAVPAPVLRVACLFHYQKSKTLLLSFPETEYEIFPFSPVQEENRVDNIFFNVQKFHRGYNIYKEEYLMHVKNANFIPCVAQ
jgi:hypothetical protein